MTRTGAKTVRFTQVVERAGQPQVHTLWLPPDKDPELKRAVHDHRVMTVAPSDRGSTDQGIVGFDAAHAKDAQFLIFPKSLKRFDGARVIGIKFGLVAQPKFAAGTEVTRASAKAHHRHKPKPAPTHAARAAAADAAPDENVVEFAPPSQPAARKTSRDAKRSRPPARAGDSALVRAVRAALKDLEAGRAVAAYQRLEHALPNR